MAKSNGIGTNSFNEDLNVLENHLERSSPIVPSLSNPINTPKSVTNIERYDEKYDKVALNHLKAQILREIKNELNLNSVQNDLSHNQYIIVSYENKIESLKTEIYFLRNGMKQKNHNIKNVLHMKQVQIENSSSTNAIKIRQDMKKCNIKIKNIRIKITLTN